MASKGWDDGVWKVEKDGLEGFEAPPSLRMITTPNLVVAADCQRIRKYVAGCMRRQERRHLVEFGGPVVLQTVHRELRHSEKKLA
jgi:hypothetical protein